MDLKNVFTIGIFATLLEFAVPMAAFGMTAEPTFPSCLNPQSALKVQYTSGIHGIAGDTNQFTGADAVYSVSDTTQMQCFCPPNGQGIQTNWWNISGLSDTDIQSLQQQGWIYESFGADWGLTNAPYLAKNSNYSCQTQSTAIVQGITQTNTASSNTGNSNTPTNSGNSGTTSTPSLANTGDSILLYGTFLAGLASLLTGIILKKR